MEIASLYPAGGSRKRRKRIGRGIAAGQGKTCGRGHKGDKARGSSKIGFEGGQTPLHRRLPRRRGFTNIFRRQFAEVNVSRLEVFEAGTDVTPELLLEKRIIRRKLDGVKVLGEGNLTKKLTVHAHAFTRSAIAKIQGAGGSADIIGQGVAAAVAAEEAPVAETVQAEAAQHQVEAAAPGEDVADAAELNEETAEGSTEEA